MSDQISVEWGRIAAIGPRGDVERLIAATAIVHDLIRFRRLRRAMRRNQARAVRASVPVGEALTLRRQA
ncbi:hypothetical protein J2Y55_003268 [Bosea sp. BE125]|nr:hypothetical protein [Bosea sp. BE125]